MVAEELLEIMIKLSKVSLFQRRTVKELLWGYRDPMLPIDTGLFVSVSTDTSKQATGSNKRQLPTLCHVLRQYNGSNDGIYTVFTGKEDISKVGVIDSWREKK